MKIINFHLQFSQKKQPIFFTTQKTQKYFLQYTKF